jgi:hypothetical protein
VGLLEDDRAETALDNAELMREIWDLWKMTEMKQL